MNRKEVETILKQNNIVVKKKFGQNFLLDEKVLSSIATLLPKENRNNVIEIGPGLGFLTEQLSLNANKVVCYEIDDEMIPYLQAKQWSNVTIIHQDILKANINNDINSYFKTENVSVIANLPYYITTPILIKLLAETKQINNYLVMMQKEVAKRLCGKPKTKDYNALSVLIQYYTEAKIVLNVSPNSFYPEPDVDSSVLLLTRKEEIKNKAINEDKFLVFIKALFAQRRKTLYNNLTKELKISSSSINGALNHFSLSSTVRSEELSVDMIVNLFNYLYINYQMK